ncbi:MAG: hypothetical protein ABDI20_01235, partial [Candidatus Bipolaricaulaceae bacterium]
MRIRYWVFMVVILLALREIGLAQYSHKFDENQELDRRKQCSDKLYGNQELDRRTLSVPATIIAKIVEKVILEVVTFDIEVTIEFNARMEFRLDCSCRPCCRAPEKQVASLSVSSSVRAFGGTVTYTGVRLETRDGEKDPRPDKMCERPVVLGYEIGDRIPALGVSLSLGGAKFQTERVIMNFSAIPHCGCTGDPRCFGNTAPSIISVAPAWLDLNKGQSALITVTAVDREGNLASFPSEIEGGDYIPTVLVPGSVRFGQNGAVGEAIYRVEFPTHSKRLRGFAPVRVEDACNERDGKNIPVRLFYPPVLTSVPERSGWSNGVYLQTFVVEDPDFQGCNRDRWEVVTVSANAMCGEVYPLESTVSCWCVNEECRTHARTFIPRGNCCDRSFTIVATDLSPTGRQRDVLPVTVPNRAPYLTQAGHVFAVRPGKTTKVWLEARDPDGDVVTITQTSGPGRIEDRKWQWEVPHPYWGPSWRLVGFELEDACGLKTRQHF